MGTLPYRGPRHFPRMRAEAFNALPSYIGPSHTCDRTRCLVFSPSPHPPVVCWSSIEFPNNYHNICARFQAILLRNVPSISFRRTFPAVRPSCSSCSVRTASPPTRGVLYSSLCSIVSPRPRIRMYSPSASRLGVSRAAIFPLWVLHEIPRIPQIQIRDSYTPTGLLPTNKTSVSNSVSSLSNHMNAHICPSRHQVTTAFSPGQTLSLSFFVTPTVRDFLEVGMTTAPPGSPAGHETWLVRLHRPSTSPLSCQGRRTEESMEKEPGQMFALPVSPKPAWGAPPDQVRKLRLSRNKDACPRKFASAAGSLVPLLCRRYKTLYRVIYSAKKRGDGG